MRRSAEQKEAIEQAQNEIQNAKNDLGRAESILQEAGLDTQAEKVFNIACKVEAVQNGLR